MVLKYVVLTILSFWEPLPPQVYFKTSLPRCLSAPWPFFYLSVMESLKTYSLPSQCLTLYSLSSFLAAISMKTITYIYISAKTLIWAANSYSLLDSSLWGSQKASQTMSKRQSWLYLPRHGTCLRHGTIYHRLHKPGTWESLASSLPFTPIQSISSFNKCLQNTTLQSGCSCC